MPQPHQIHMYNVQRYHLPQSTFWRRLFCRQWEKWHHIIDPDKQKGAEGTHKMPVYCLPSVASCERIWHANIYSFVLVTETLRARWLAGSAFKCGYRGPQILTECQILRNYWCTQPATAPDTSQTESLNVTDKWIFMKLGEKTEKQEDRKNTE